MQELTPPQLLLCQFLEELSESGKPPPTIREICERLGFRSTKAAVDLIVALERKGVVTRDKKSARGVRLKRQISGVPLLGRIVAGHPSDATEDHGERLPLNPQHFGIRNPSNAFAVRVSGDSMSGRNLVDGDIVMFDAGAEPQNNDIVAALVDNESTLKTLLRRNGKSWLHAENPRYPDIVPAADLQIQGVARAVIRFLT